MRYSGFTDKGLQRNGNEDSFFMAKNLFIISDGMGGHDRGEVASKIIVTTLKEEIENFQGIIADKNIQKESIKKLLNDSVIKSRTEIKEFVKKNNLSSKMGATLVGIYFDKNLKSKLTTFHLGDSRAYMVREGVIIPLTIDHSIYEDMRRSGRYIAEDLKNVNRHIITKAIGNFKFDEVEVNFYNMKKDDIYILCSDGVSDLCADDEILSLVLENLENLDEVCLKIKELVYERGARDNLSFVIVEV